MLAKIAVTGMDSWSLRNHILCIYIDLGILFLIGDKIIMHDQTNCSSSVHPRSTKRKLKALAFNFVTLTEKKMTPEIHERFVCISFDNSMLNTVQI